ERLPDVAGAIRELLRVTRPGGAFVTYLPNYFALTRARSRAIIAGHRGERGPHWLLVLREVLRGIWVPLTKVLNPHSQVQHLEPMLGDDWRDSDYDAVTAVHPLDAVRIFRAEGCRARLQSSPSDSRRRRVARRVLWHFGPGWWVVVRKPEA
ncbi:MAG: hypothetical protein PVH68_13485, partial [Armatimonadota bacterium]